MALTLGSGPFGGRPAGTFNFSREGPSHVLYFEDTPRRVRVELDGQTIAESKRMKLMHETGYLPVYYFPVDDVHWQWLEPSEHRTHCPFKGDAAYWTVRVGERRAENAAWRYPSPVPSCPPISGFVAFVWKAMDAWYEEEEPVFVHPRDPYHRIDVRQSARHVRVRVRGRLVAESWRPRALFETGLVPRYYLPDQDIHVSLERSGTVTQCPYKGISTYWNARVGDELVSDVAFSYQEPLLEARPVAGYRCFAGRRVELEVDGEPAPA